MQQEDLIHTERKQFLDRIFEVNQLHGGDLDEISLLIEKYPYCQPLRLIAAKSASNTAFHQKYLEDAAARIPSRQVLYDILYHPHKFETHAVAEVEEEPEFEVARDAEPIVFAEKEEHRPVEEILPKEEAFEENAPLDEFFVESENAVAIENLSLDGEHYAEASIPEEGIAHTEEQVNIAAEPEEEIEVAEAPYIETLGDEYHQTAAREALPEQLDEQETAAALMSAAKAGDIFRYHEERLPYTFLWWLNKTRKEYQNIRPYATFRLDTAKAINKRSEEEVINHQIAENIFHLTSTEELEKSVDTRKTVTFDFMKKEHHIIERFLKEEPQIAPPQASKIDTENKAKKSSEDSNELVSETLAKVYVEQMLYHKALDIYKKLSLKYPEKNAYFASQIKYLELKVN